jgi:hypothetical protein
VKKVTSRTTEGASIVTVEFEWGTDLDYSAQDIRDKLGFIKDYLPKATITAPTGEITTSDKFGYLTEQLAYASAKKAASEIKKLIKAKLEGLGYVPKILIIDHLDSANNDILYIELLLQFRVFDTALINQIKINKEIIVNIDAILKQPPKMLAIETGLLAAPYAVSAIAELASYFRTDYKMFGRDFKVNSDALLTAIAGEIVNESPPSSRKVYIYNNYLLDIPPIMTYNAYNTHQDPKLETLTLIEIFTLYCDLVNEAAICSSAIKSRVDENKDTKDPKLKEELAKASNAINNTDVILKSASEFIKAVTTIETGQTKSKMGNGLLRDKIRRLGDKNGITHLLSITIPSSGGDTITVRKFLNNSTKYLGGLVISFVLASVSGEILEANTVSYYGLINFNLKKSKPDKFTCVELKEG